LKSLDVLLAPYADGRSLDGGKLWRGWGCWNPQTIF